jgi:hypothetical protein
MGRKALMQGRARAYGFIAIIFGGKAANNL